MAGNTSKNSSKNLQSYLTNFDHKRTSVRENSLTSLVNSLTCRPHHNFVEQNHITISHTCLTRLTSNKKPSNKFSKLEITRAIRAVSLVAISIVTQHSAHELFDECVPLLSDALVGFKSDVEVVLEVLGCLGVVGFFCSSNSMEVERVMLVVWEFMVKGSDFDLSAPQISETALVLSAAIYCWSFLLSRVCKQGLSTKHWRKSVCFFSRLLETQDGGGGGGGENVVLSASKALGLILEFDMIESFAEECKERGDQALLNEEIVRKIEGCSGNTSSCKTGNLGKVIQVKFMKKLLGKDGFGCHVKDNENFHGLFESISRNKGKKVVDDEIDHSVPQREEVVLKFFNREVERRNVDDLLPFVSDKEKKVQYRMGKSPSSALNKARTQLLNKQRKVVNPDFDESEYYD